MAITKFLPPANMYNHATVHNQFAPKRCAILSPDEDHILEILLTKIAKGISSLQLDEYLVTKGKIQIADKKYLKIVLGKRHESGSVGFNSQLFGSKLEKKTGQIGEVTL